MIGIPSRDVHAAWPHVSAHVEKALRYGHGEYKLHDIYDALTSAKMQLWAAGESIAVTTIVRYPQKATCLVVLAGGNLKTLKRHLPTLELWAKANGCSDIDAIGRGGWQRALADQGYSQAYVHLRKDL